jgi:hypothetical protein
MWEVAIVDAKRGHSASVERNVGKKSWSEKSAVEKNGKLGKVRVVSCLKLSLALVN